ncbi:MAG: Ca2+-dependent phosphoinositide-specific phospholipase C [Chitinophagales bacterium]|jgi:hypothetical protein|tara:strand:- start:676 stop:1830 length:1155 start_codon:yes stop_codon:yes gene_type:complete
MKYFLVLVLIGVLSFTSCKKDEFVPKEIINFIDGDVPDDLKINQIQYLGSHNSYRYRPEQELLNFILGLANILPAEFNPVELDYEHLPLQDQFKFYGIRQIEIDLFLDTQGGLYYNRRGYGLINQDLESGIPSLLEPGIKVLHIPDIDYNSHQLSFIENLQEIKSWSDQFPDHIPLFILLELSEKTVNSTLPNVGFTQPESWNNQAALNSIEQEILSVFSREEIILPDDIRSNYNTLNEAVLNDNWPTIAESRGKIVFLLNNQGITTQIYTSGAPSLENKLLFTNGVPGDADAAFLLRNSISASLSEINQLAAQGYMIRTRVDAGTYEARSNDYSSWLLALQSGAHFLSTDYYKPDAREGDGEWSSYSVRFDNGLYRSNPVTNP